MAVKVGINGFGRIGRNLFRAAKAAGADIDFVAVNDLIDAETLAHLLKYDSILGRYPGEVEVGKDGLSVDGDELKVLSEKDPADAAVGRPRRRRRDRVHRPVHQARGRLEAPRGRRQEGDHLGARDRARHHGRARRQLRRLRPRAAQHHLQRLLHHQLPGAGREGAARRGRHRPRADDHDPRLHGRPAPAGHAPQGPAPRPRRGDQPDPDLDRRREGGRPGAAGAERQAQRDGDPRPRGHGLGRRPDLPGVARRRASRRSTRRSRRPPTAT